KNIIENAIKYSTPDSPIQIDLHSREQQWELTVQDRGVGIPKEDLERVFEPFYRALGTNVDGSGLGLPIVREIAKRHGATVTVEMAHPGQTPPGACFTIRFSR
ncbi:MAG: Sensor protein QseC, partial [Pseudomonadota bacterium]